MKLIISPRAARGLREIQAHIALDADLNTALRVIIRIRQSAETLVDFPEIAPKWDGGTSRALIVSGLPWLTPEAVEIITIAHTSRKPLRFA
ncbi:type II toxin-antitoxin system RelE/ParE family toxin [uncultured Agrobacterium sp.]|uniref:type II toxin-antitoxin system RelE/ParE family toxin n=1 Tax=uncultured Agrobacterium sp. TaxID=157277 RepID=UPI0025DCC95A|nr:type II toxin-antitoxin system RelE/ParE family toxin [uncultured Agrobacterium sp.]